MKRAAAKASGKAKIRAIAVVIRVLTIDGKAPNFSAAGFHSLEMKKRQPNSFHASVLASKSCIKKPAVNSKTREPQNQQMPLKQLSVFIMDIFITAYLAPSRLSAMMVEFLS